MMRRYLTCLLVLIVAVLMMTRALIPDPSVESASYEGIGAPEFVSAEANVECIDDIYFPDIVGF